MVCPVCGIRVGTIVASRYGDRGFEVVPICPICARKLSTGHDWDWDIGWARRNEAIHAPTVQVEVFGEFLVDHGPAYHQRVTEIHRSETLTPKPPPSWATLALHFLLPHRRRLAIIGDLAEEYGEMSQKHGRKAAIAWYVWQAVRSTIQLGILATIMRWVTQAVNRHVQ